MNMTRIFPVLVLSFLAAHCAGSKFNGAGNVADAGNTGNPPGTNPGPNGALDLTCETTTEKAISVSPKSGADVVVKDDSEVKMSVKGRFCPTISDNLTVLFIIDFSGSMGPNKPDASNQTFQAAGGNDPRIAAGTTMSCGRLQAVEAIMAKFKAGDKVSIGTVAFASDVVETHSAAPVDAESFRGAKLTEAAKLGNFCSYVAPDRTFEKDPMALPSPRATGSTNYAAAFDRAYQFLKDVKGRKAVYFITDGRPTAGGIDPVAAGKASATRLKTVDNLFFNAFFLQNKQSGLQEDKQGFDNLVQTIGTSDRVVKVDSAAQLAVEVGKEQPVSFDPSQIKGSVSVDGDEVPLNILSFTQDPANAKAWVFETAAFVLQGQGDEVLKNVVKINAQAKDGTTHSSVVTIHYQKDSN